VPAADVVGDYEMIGSDVGENTDSSDHDDGDDDDDADRDKDNDEADNSDTSDDEDDSNDAEFSRAHKPLRGSFKTTEGISIDVVKGSIAAQKVSISHIPMLVTIQCNESALCCMNVFLIITSPPTHSVWGPD